MPKQLSKPDFLSDLPLGIIHTILSAIPIRDAVRTSLLSRQWRYTWASLPHLVFDKKCVNPPMENVSDIKRLMCFIRQALLRHKGPILMFQLRLPSIPMLPCIHQWLLDLSMNGLRILLIELRDGIPCYKNLSSLYSCQNLTHLSLSIPALSPPPPSFKGFLFLRFLDICTREVESGTIESIVALSPRLEKLKLAGTIKSEEMTIRAPNLKFFHFVHGPQISLCTPLLEKLTVYSAKIKNLSFHGSSVLHHLRIITLYYVPLNTTEVAMAVYRLLKRSPNLQKLEISNMPGGKDDAHNVSSWDTEHLPDSTFDSLKVIKMMFSTCEINEMKLMKFLLARSPVLERMIYRPRPLWFQRRIPQFTERDSLAALLGFPRASASAEIVIDKY